MTWWMLLLLAGAAYRVTRLVGWDDLTHPLRVVVTGRTDDEHHAEARVYDENPTDLPPDPARWYLSRLVRCPWCAGFWICLATAAAYWVWPAQTLDVALPLLLSALVGFAAKLDT